MPFDIKWLNKMSCCVLSQGIANQFIHNTLYTLKTAFNPQSIWIFGCQRLLIQLQCSPYVNKHLSTMKNNNQDWRGREIDGQKAVNPLRCGKSTTLITLQPWVSNLQKDPQTLSSTWMANKRNKTAAGAVWAFLTSGSSKSYTRPPQPLEY